MTNPLLTPSPLPYELPDFAALDRDVHLAEALQVGMDQQRDEIAAIVNNPEPATFDNTILALERSGDILARATRVFYQLLSADGGDNLRAIDAEFAPKLAAHHDSLLFDAGLFARIEAVYAARDTLTEESRYLVERIYTVYRLRGAALEPRDKEKLGEYNRRLSELSTEFGARLHKDTNDSAVVFDHVAELEGLAPSAISAAAAAAEARGLSGKYLITLVLPTAQPCLASLTNRQSRQRVFEASRRRGNRGNDFDTNAIVLEQVRLRAERAILLGYPNHAAFAVADQTARTPEAIEQSIYPLAEPAARNARAELADLQAFADRWNDEHGLERFALAAWDWDFYANLLKAERYCLDTTALRPYFAYDRVLKDGVFFAANQLYGITFEERPDLIGYHPDVRVFEVKDADGSGLALFLHDVYARDTKRGGAWMNNLVEQNALCGRRPVICNTLNVPKPAEGPTLLTLDEVRTMFHEFGHALHGMLSDVRYPRLSGTAVSRDFVEFPSQVNEMWLDWPEVLSNYAVHHETGEPLDPTIVAKIQESAAFNEGYATSAYLGAALLDQEWHKIQPDTAILSVAEFEAAALAKVGLDNPVVPPRYSTTYFNHTFGGSYDAGYYSYIWSEILDADTVAWFKEHGGLTRENGEHFRRELLSRGRSRDPLESYRAFRGRDAEIQPLLERRGLV